MPRLSLYRPEKSADFVFLDKVIGEQFQIGGTDIHIHKYLGPVNPAEGESSPSVPNNSNTITELGIQDLLLMENRDRHYEPDVYRIRGIYQMQDIDFALSQFGLFLHNDTIYIMFHLRDTVNNLGRKIMAGDVLELPHLKDEYALDESLVALKRFYVIQDVTRPAAGFSQTWYPHLLRAKCVPLVDSQEFKEILDTDAGAGDGSSLRDLLSTYKKSLEVNDQILSQAEEDAKESGYDTTNLFVLPVNPNTGVLNVADTSITDVDASADQPRFDASIVLKNPSKDMYVGYLTGDGIPPNGSPYGFGIEFPQKSVEGEFFLRTDYLPNRLFRFDGKRWVRFEDDVRMQLNQFGNEDVATAPNVGKKVRKTQKTTFINNNSTSTIAGNTVVEKQSLSKALKPKADG